MTPYMRMYLSDDLFNEGRIDFNVSELERGREEKIRFDCDYPNWNRERPYHDDKYPIYPVLLNFDENIIYSSIATFSNCKFGVIPTQFGIYNFGQWDKHAFVNTTTQNNIKYHVLKRGTLNALTMTYNIHDLTLLDFIFDVKTKNFTPQ